MDSQITLQKNIKYSVLDIYQLINYYCAKLAIFFANIKFCIVLYSLLWVIDEDGRLAFFCLRQLKFWILRWLMWPNFYLKIPWLRSAYGELGLGCCFLIFRRRPISFRLADRLDSKSVVSSLTMDRHRFLSIAVDSQLLMSILHFFMFCFRTSLNHFFWFPLFDFLFLLGVKYLLW